jgi:hypothetical protein
VQQVPEMTTSSPAMSVPTKRTSAMGRAAGFGDEQARALPRTPQAVLAKLSASARPT